MKFNYYFVVCVAFIAFNVGLAAEVTGKPTSCSVFDWWIAPAVLLYLGLPFVGGYLAGREDK